VVGASSRLEGLVGACANARPDEVRGLIVGAAQQGKMKCGDIVTGACAGLIRQFTEVGTMISFILFEVICVEAPFEAHAPIAA
jgi:hypothetical protein